jgi:DNA-directed RNA polymerase subunit RPC12/RpoP
MSFRFYCSHCHQRLSVSAQKRGQEVKCPRCRRVIVVPQAELAGEPDAAPDDVPEPLPSVTVGGTESAAAATPPTGADLRQRVTLPRYVIYTQGILLAGVALLFFVCGLIVGSHATDPVATAAGGAVTVSGTVLCQSPTGAPVPDAGSVILLLPAERHPDEKFSAAGLRPEDPLAAEDHPARMLLRELGGDYARADRRGRYRVRAAAAGRYHVVVISRGQRRAADQSPAASDLARLGRYFIPPTELLGEQQYRWQELLLRQDQQLEIRF